MAAGMDFGQFFMDANQFGAQQQYAACGGMSGFVPLATGPCGYVDHGPQTDFSATGPYGLLAFANGPRGYVDHRPQSDFGFGTHPSYSPASYWETGQCAATDSKEDSYSNKSTEFASIWGDEDSLSDVEVYASVAARALILIDWDDTLFPTTWVQVNGLMETPCSQSQREELARLTAAVQATLNTASRYNGKVVIVTNADAGWVELTMAHFMPALTSYLSEIEVVSARALHEHTGVACPFEWKRRTFKDLCENFYDADEARNIVCLGDSMHEHTAMANVVVEMRNTVSKSVKFAIRPSLDQLIRQHDALAAKFDDVVAHNGYMYVDV